MDKFTLAAAFFDTSEPLASLKLSEARLQADARFPWVVLIPRRTGARELEHLKNGDRAQLMEEIIAADDVDMQLRRVVAECAHVELLHRPADGRTDGPDQSGARARLRPMMTAPWPPPSPPPPPRCAPCRSPPEASVVQPAEEFAERDHDVLAIGRPRLQTGVPGLDVGDGGARDVEFEVAVERGPGGDVR